MSRCGALGVCGFPVHCDATVRINAQSRDANFSWLIVQYLALKVDLIAILNDVPIRARGAYIRCTQTIDDLWMNCQSPLKTAFFEYSSNTVLQRKIILR